MASKSCLSSACLLNLEREKETSGLSAAVDLFGRLLGAPLRYFSRFIWLQRQHISSVCVLVSYFVRLDVWSPRRVQERPVRDERRL